MTTRVTIHEVAAAAGVSVSTVSKVMNGRYGIAPRTVDRVQAVVRELGYESSLGARSIRSQRSGVIGVLVPEIEPFSAEVLKGVSQVLHDTAYDLLAYSGSRQRGSEGWERRSLNRLSGSMIDGAILVTPTVVNVGVDIPVVAVDPHTGPADLPTVESDSFAGAREAVRYLIDLGHERIGYVSGRADLRSSAAREAGYRKALADAGIRPDPRLIVEGQYEDRIVRRVARALLQHSDRPTAVFAANDVSALAVIDTAVEMGLDVPRDLSVIGFDDIPEASRSLTRLTTVRQQIQRVGAEATRMLLTLLEGQEPRATHIRLPTRLVPRATTARVHAGVATD
ncbi:LacI family DNA-binding transcriptional regulator [Microbacterium sp. C7(2022)]|uniref:LacI family DNA-binding transcriptional regulator n=1 Tax=Microbacterium sp. C7(2022) TaxID=2992759 RepID=UPI00237ADA4C|nr:LacI family DNA-binding transcriptional regulator [Microbacterium sp. C7(2022)]MDE0545233.1 LacI family transcriptional regulator [Microbacterium sp. C7(2022)]